MRQSTLSDYHERINKVLAYINLNLGEQLEIEKLAALSNFSLFHFHRIMRAHLNESLGAYIIRLRLEKALWLLEQSEMNVSDIAYKIGYDTPASLTKAFTNRYGMSPTDFRNLKTTPDIYKHFNYLNIQKYQSSMELKPKVKEIKPLKVVYIQTIEKYGGEKMQESWGKLIEFMKRKRLFGFRTQCLGISHDDPTFTEPDRCRYDACFVVSKDVAPEGEIGFKTVEGGKYAIFSYKGAYENLNLVYNEIFRKWLPESGYELRELPPFDMYMNNPEKTKPENRKTDIYIPLK
jgi:AraC family transcriptional regulator